MSVPEATFEENETGREVSSDGWFVVNLADARWYAHERGGTYCRFDSREFLFADFGINVHVLEPGQPNGKYHSENVQESFLVLSGECILLIEEEERRLRAGDFVHCPAGTLHIFVGAGDGPCAILMAGARKEDEEIRYPVTELAVRHGAAAPHETDSPPEAYSDWPNEFTPKRMPWPPA